MCSGRVVHLRLMGTGPGAWVLVYSMNRKRYDAAFSRDGQADTTALLHAVPVRPGVRTHAGPRANPSPAAENVPLLDSDK